MHRILVEEKRWIGEERFLHALNTWPRFGVGWTNRVADLRAYSKHLAAGNGSATAPDEIPVMRTGKAKHVAGTLKGTTATAATAAAGGGAATGIPYHQIAVVVGAIVVMGVAYEAYEIYTANKANAKVYI